MSFPNKHRIKANFKFNSRLFEKIKTKYYEEKIPKIEYNGERHTLLQWSMILGIKKGTLKTRLYKYKSVEKAFGTPVIKKYEINGEFLTLKEISLKYNVNYSRLRIEHKRGLSFEYILRDIEKKFEYNGEIHTLREWSNITGIKVGTLRSRLDTLKMSFKEAIETPIPEKNIKYDYNGEKYTLKEISKKTNIPYYTIKNRMERGLNLKQAIEKEKRIIKKRIFIIDGKEMTINDISKKYNISREVIYERLTVLKWPIQKILETEVLQMNKKISYNGKKYLIVEFAKKYGINEVTLRMWLKRGYTPEQCIQKQIQNNEIITDITYNGETHSLKDWSKITGINFSTLRTRKSRGWDVSKMFYDSKYNLNSDI